MKNNYDISPAAPSDLKPMADLLHFLFSQEADFVPDKKKQMEGLQLILDHPERGQLLVIKKEALILGMVNLLFTLSTALGGKVAILEDMIVHPDYRNKGLGKELLQQALAFAKNEGCLRITLLTDVANSQAQQFYKNSGFEPSAMVPYRLVF